MPLPVRVGTRDQKQAKIERGDIHRGGMVEEEGEKQKQNPAVGLQKTYCPITINKGSLTKADDSLWNFRFQFKMQILGDSVRACLTL